MKPRAGIRSQQDTMRNERAVAEDGSFGAVHRNWKEEYEKVKLLSTGLLGCK